MVPWAARWLRNGAAFEPMTCSKAWFSSTITMRWLGWSGCAARAWAGGEVTPARVVAQPISTATTTVLAAVVRHLPTPAIGDPSSTPRPSHATLAHDPAAVVPAGGHFPVPASCNLGRTSDAAARGSRGIVRCPARPWVVACRGPVPVRGGRAHTLRHGRDRRELAVRRSHSRAGPSGGGVRPRRRRRSADPVRRRRGRRRQDPAGRPVRRSGPRARRAGAARRLRRAGRDGAAVRAPGPGAPRPGPRARAGGPGRAGRAGPAAAGPAAARARAGGGLDRPGRRLVGAGAAVRGAARPAGAPGRPVPDRA